MLAKTRKISKMKVYKLITAIGYKTFVANGDIARLEQFLLLTQCFQKSSICGKGLTKGISRSLLECHDTVLQNR